MTFDQAVGVIRKHVTEQDGLQATLRRGRGLDHAAYAELVAALRVLADQWRGEEYVPKNVVALVYWLDRALENLSYGYTGEEAQQIREKAMEMTEVLIEVLES